MPNRFCLAIALAGVAAAASAQNPAATCECNPKSGTLVIRYTDDFNHTNPPWPKRLTAVEFYSLLDLNKEGMEVEGTRSKTIACRLGRDRFEIVFEPGVPNVNLLGRCGGALTGVVTVKRNGAVVVDEQEFENLNCHERTRLLARMMFRTGKPKPQLYYTRYASR